MLTSPHKLNDLNTLRFEQAIVTEHFETGGLFTEPGHSSALKLDAGERVVLKGRTPTQFYSGRCRGETGEFPTEIVQVSPPSADVPWARATFDFEGKICILLEEKGNNAERP